VMNVETSLAKVGFDVAGWCEAVGISRACFYRLRGPGAPAIVKIGKRTIIMEAPAAFLQRLAQAQGAVPLQGGAE
jgi:hypothetical protein